MKLCEIEFSKFNTVNMACSKFSREGKAIQRKCNLYPVETITSDDSLRGFYIETASYDSYTNYVLWNNCGDVIAVKYFTFSEEQDISAVKETLYRNKEFWGTEGYKNLLSQSETKGAYINLAEIYALQLLGESELVEHYNKYRENYLKLREKKEREQEEQRRLEQQKQEEARQRAFDLKIAEAENCIRKNNLLRNELLDDGRHLILYLMKKHNIDVPLRTQGWINNKLISVTYGADNMISLQFYKSKGGKCSSCVYEYLKLLKTAVDAAVRN